MKHYGIIGKPLEHSWSAQWFTDKFRREGIDADYTAFETEPDTILPPVPLDGFNVTCPYKEAVIPLLDGLDPVAAEIGAVNTVVRRGSRLLIGYNTDWLGFTAAIHGLQYVAPHKRPGTALVLGTGGAAKAVIYALRRLGIAVTSVSRDPHKGLPYSALTPEIISQHLLLINCTPLGMFPDTSSMPAIPYDGITSRHILFDCIYNPAETLFLREGRLRGAVILNGLSMLTSQATSAWQLWNSVS